MLHTGLFSPFHQHKILDYLNISSNYPKSVINFIIRGVSNKTTKLSVNEEIFKENANYFNEDLSRTGYEKNLLKSLRQKYMKIDNSNNFTELINIKTR